MLCTKQGVKALKTQEKQEKHHCVQLRGVQIAVVFSLGDPPEIRTPDTLLKRQVLCLLS